ncbi:TPA: hypothetical protein JI276_003643 [Serratia marcescens]|uniref:hypothetical protein n=1 Tax=Serratia bockelmannii TaxID=2703793 RepID=UPI0018DA302D|nr:hypothetical protein [Serratia bockelmannii]MBH3104502.1 hypothetical protein [Serratia marcescens]MCW7610277.1 hypothetical protein [Serratia bockelmannii]HAV5986654.1 hypothetical protein [Serratia marcescens]
MSLTNSLLLIFICLGLNGCAFERQPDERKAYYVKFVGNPDRTKMAKLENFILSKKIGSISSLAIIYSDNHYDSAIRLQEEIQKQYGINAVLQESVNQLDANYIAIGNRHKTERGCYRFRLSDFNWYSSDEQALDNYSEREVCSINSNDFAERAR